MWPTCTASIWLCVVRGYADGEECRYGCWVQTAGQINIGRDAASPSPAHLEDRAASTLHILQHCPAVIMILTKFVVNCFAI